MFQTSRTVPNRRTRGSPHHHYHHPARQSASELPPFPLLPHRDWNHQNPAAQIVKSSTYHTGDWALFGGYGPQKVLCCPVVIVDHTRLAGVLIF
ncbi:hypothetical protein AVEN_214395-1 [Araneus ventricosus]|uniref:Uncharacterized protein n=1 Tax=Araneus ventricosus TaxID=182803 RepID=A0A4Y2UBZ1_ARAVE|nr:hypothetical protein AVEN_214395-1 [Araneus ventricosus]